MPTTGFSPIEPGDALSATSLTTQMDGIEAAINGVPVASVEPDSLTRQHLPSAVVGTPKWVTLNLAIGAEAIYSSQVGAEPYPGWDTVAGWKVVNDVGTATGANTLTATGLGVAMSSTVGIEVWADTEIVDIEWWDFGGGARAGATARSFRILGVFAIQYSSDGATWYHIPRTERYFHADCYNNATNATGVAQATVPQQGKRATIATLIRHTDAGGSITVNQVRMVCSCHALGLVGAGLAVRLRLRQANLSAEGIMFGSLT